MLLWGKNIKETISKQVLVANHQKFLSTCNVLKCTIKKLDTLIVLKCFSLPKWYLSWSYAWPGSRPGHWTRYRVSSRLFPWPGWHLDIGSNPDTQQHTICIIYLCVTVCVLGCAQIEESVGVSLNVSDIKLMRPVNPCADMNLCCGQAAVV